VSAPAKPAADSVLYKLASMGFSFDAVQAGFRNVPRLFLATLPGDIADVAVPEKRKAVFVGTLLPLILRVNEIVLADRQRILELRDQERRGHELADAEREWLRKLAERYGAAREDCATLLLHVDAVPPSLALAQAAEESGWGTSRFASDGNALFGQRVWKRGAGITPAERARGARFEVRAFARLESSVAAYIHNLNSHAAYRGFRDQRADLRKASQQHRGDTLVVHLERYSERGADYVVALRNIIRDNDFGRFDSARLSPPAPTRLAAYSPR
jgi:Bax protein